MMRGIYFLAEGATEVQFIESCLRDYFNQRGIYDIRAINLAGAINFSRFKTDATTLLKREKDIILTSLIDFFRLSTDFPGYWHAKVKINGSNGQVSHIESEVEKQIANPRFIPYIQLHEFEGLLFSDVKGFSQLPYCTPEMLNKLESIIKKYPNPEEINEGPETAPGKRLLRIIPGYDKPLFGAYIALENGLDSIIIKCPRFRNWLEVLEDKVKGGGQF